MPYTHLSIEDELNIIKDNFVNDISINQIKKKYHISDKKISDIFFKHGLKPRKNVHQGKYQFNNDFFLQDSEYLAYFLGLMSSDGYIASNDNHIGIELARKDKKVLEDISLAMGYNRPILDIERKERGNGEFSKFILENAKIKRLLIDKYGIVPQKTYDKNFCFNFINLDKKYWKDYIRGYFDGDGSIKITGTSLTFQIDGTSIKMLLGIQQALRGIGCKSELSLTCRYPQEEQSGDFQQTLPLYRLYCYSKSAEEVFHIIYQDANIYLQRKFDKYKQYVK